MDPGYQGTTVSELMTVNGATTCLLYQTIIAAAAGGLASSCCSGKGQQMPRRRGISAHGGFADALMASAAC
jgi:hypothetical protein